MLKSLVYSPCPILGVSLFRVAALEDQRWARFSFESVWVKILEVASESSGNPSYSVEGSDDSHHMRKRSETIWPLNTFPLFGEQQQHSSSPSHRYGLEGIGRLTLIFSLSLLY